MSSLMENQVLPVKIAKDNSPIKEFEIDFLALE
jgi:hypothetical protein